jgi:hypothetical protein
LYYELDLPNTGAGRDTYELTSSGRIKGTSIGFQTFGDEFRREGATIVRHLLSIRLAHISPTAQPAYPSTVTAVRSLARQIGEDENDVAALAERGELRSLFSDRAAPVVIDVGATEHSSSDEAALRELETLRKLNDERAKRYGLDGDVDPLLDLSRRRNRNRAMRDPAPVTESRTQWLRPVV